MDEAEFLTSFWGKAEEPVPQVDPSDMKALWKLGEDARKSSQSVGGIVITVDVMENYCKPGANIGAITYRARIIGMLQHIFPEVMDPLIKDKLDAVLAAASEIPMVWIGNTVHHGWTFDPDEFVRRVREA